MKTLSIVLATVVAGIAAFFAYILSGLFNVAAVEEGPVLNWILYTAREASVDRRAREIEPPSLDSREMILAGAAAYSETCSQCHGEPGRDPGPIKQGMYPPPPDLEDLAEDSAEEQFWIIQNGIGMTGMPAFGETHTEDELWSITAFLQEARDMPAREYERLKAEAEQRQGRSQSPGATGTPALPGGE